MTTTDHAPWPSPTGVGAALDDVLCSVEPHRRRPPLTYLRRKPGRGLVAVYGTAKAPRDMYTVTVEESAVASDLVEPGRMPHHLTLEEVPELVEIPPLGLTIQRFPHDERLPSLAAAVTPYEHPQLRDALEQAATELLGTSPGTLRLVSVDAVPLRYKPGDRCVLRYRLRLQRATSATGAAGLVQLGVIGKLYREPGQAHAAAELMARLVGAQGEQPWTARPLAVVDALALVLSEDLGSDRDDPPTLVGTDVIRGGTTQPTQALRAAARALAELHTSNTLTAHTPARTGADEAGKAAKRAGTIAQYVPTLAGETDRVASRLCATLSALPRDVLRSGTRVLQVQPAAVPGGLGSPRRLRPVLPRRPGPGCRLLPGLPAAAGTLVPPGRDAARGSPARRPPSSPRTTSASPSAAWMPRPARASGGAATSTRRRCCSRSRPGAPTGCTAPGPGRSRRCWPR